MRAARAGVAIEHINQSYIRKEDLVQRVLAKCGDAPGLVHVLFAMEACPSYRRWHDQMSGKTYWRGDAGKYLHYYFYFIAEELGLCCMRVPTWAPFGLQFYCNGHRMLALSRQLTRLRLLGLIKKSGSYLSLLPDSFGPQRHRCRRFIYPIQHRPCHRRSALNSSQKMQRHKSLETNSLLNFSAFGNSEIFRPRRKPYKRFF